jgi:hypothetical protein
MSLVFLLRMMTVLEQSAEVCAVRHSRQFAATAKRIWLNGIKWLIFPIINQIVVHTQAKLFLFSDDRVRKMAAVTAVSRTTVIRFPSEIRIFSFRQYIMCSLVISLCLMWHTGAGTWSWPLTFILCHGWECVELVLSSSYVFMTWRLGAGYVKPELPRILSSGISSNPDYNR